MLDTPGLINPISKSTIVMFFFSFCCLPIEYFWLTIGMRHLDLAQNIEVMHDLQISVEGQPSIEV